MPNDSNDAFWPYETETRRRAILNTAEIDLIEFVSK